MRTNSKLKILILPDRNHNKSVNCASGIVFTISCSCIHTKMLSPKTITKGYMICSTLETLKDYKWKIKPLEIWFTLCWNSWNHHYLKINWTQVLKSFTSHFWINFQTLLKLFLELQKIDFINKMKFNFHSKIESHSGPWHKLEPPTKAHSIHWVGRNAG